VSWDWRGSVAYGQQSSSPALVGEWIDLFTHQLSHCALQDGEAVLAVTDTAFHPNYAAACMSAAHRLGAAAVQLTLPYRSSIPEAALDTFFSAADLIVYSTTQTLHYSAAMRAALDRGARALMAVVPFHILERRCADPELIRRTKWGAQRIAAADEIRITSHAGTDLVGRKGTRPGVGSYGVADEAGHLDFWGAGFFQCALIERALEGRLVLDAGDLVFHFGVYVDRPVEIEFREGRIVSIRGGVVGRMIDHLLSSFQDDHAWLAGHLSFGTDPRAIWTAEAHQFPVIGGGGADAEAVYGNVQVEIGSNNDVMFQGRNSTKAHLGLCSLRCSVWLDGEPLLCKGQYLPKELRIEGFALNRTFRSEKENE
jgi:2,5-dihydroxypyridine 5,6-dioxygenase